MAIRPGDTEPPFVLGKLVRFLQARAAPELFQKKPNSAEVAALRSRLTADKTTAAGLQLSSYIKDPHVVAEVLKQYLAALPDPIFTYDYYNSFMNVLAIIDLGDRLSMLRMLIYSLPPGYQSTALCLLELFHILHKSSIMDAEKLSLIFGPCFLRPEHQQAFMSSDNLTCCQLLQLIIEHGELIMRPDSSKMAALPPSPVRHLCLPIQRFNAIAISRKQGVVLPPDELPPLYSAAEVTNSSGPGQTSLSSASESPESPSSSSSSSSSSSLSSSTSSPSPSSSSAALASPEGSMPSEPTLISSTSFTSSSFDEQAGDHAVAAPLAEADLEVASEQPFDDTDLNGAAVGDSIPDITSFISVSVIGSPQQPAMSSPLRSSTSPSTLSPLRDEDSGLSLTTPTSSALLRVRGSEPRHVRSSSVNTEIFIPPDSPPLPPPPTGSPPAPGFLPSPDLDSSPLANDPLALRQEIASAVQLLGLCASKVKDSQISPTQLSQQLRDLNRLLLGTAVDTLRLDPNDVPISHEIVSQDELAAIDTASPVGELTKLLFEGLNEAASTLRFLEAKNTDKSEETVAAVCAKVNAVLRSVVA